MRVFAVYNCKECPFRRPEHSEVASFPTCKNMKELSATPEYGIPVWCPLDTMSSLVAKVGGTCPPSKDCQCNDMMELCRMFANGGE